LLHVGSAPSSEGLEVRETRVVVVVSIPKRLARTDGTARASDLGPHGRGSINTNGVTSSSLDEIGNELTVGLSVGAPTTVGAGIGLNIQPNGAVRSALSLKEGDHGSDLSGSGLASTWEKIDIDGGDASGLGSRNGTRSIAIRCSVR
jgi:hypothetical protein